MIPRSCPKNSFFYIAGCQVRLSKAGYYSDFYVYPIVILGLTASALVRATVADAVAWLAATLVGVVIWTLLEYAMHRVAFHRIAFFIPMHDEHHRAPLAYIGTPTWMTLSVLLTAFFVPAWMWLSFTVASGLTAGVMSGYVWYGALHHLIHHPRYRLPLVGRLRAWHLRHHYSKSAGNFGVTTTVWDYVFRTALAARSVKQG